MIFKIKHLIHCISSKSIGINFCWVPSHCGFYWNEVADNLAKQGALRSEKSICFSTLHLSSSEINSLLTKNAFVEFQNNKNSILSCPRNVASLIYKLRLNSWKTKYSENISCICLGKISVHHIFFECPVVLKLMRDENIHFDKKVYSSQDILYSSDNFLVKLIQRILHSPVGKLL